MTLIKAFNNSILGQRLFDFEPPYPKMPLLAGLAAVGAC